MIGKLDLAIRELHRAENDLAATLLHVSDRHRTDHEIFHVARDLARWSQEHVRKLAEAGTDYEVDLDPDPAGDHAIVAKVRRRSAELLGRRHAPQLLLLTDLRRLHQKAAGVSVDWELVAQAAQALKHEDLLGLAKDCHPQTLRQLRWANAALKENAPQILAAP